MFTVTVNPAVWLQGTINAELTFIRRIIDTATFARGRTGSLRWKTVERGLCRQSINYLWQLPRSTMPSICFKRCSSFLRWKIEPLKRFLIYFSFNAGHASRQNGMSAGTASCMQACICGNVSCLDALEYIEKPALFRSEPFKFSLNHINGVWNIASNAR